MSGKIPIEVLENRRYGSYEDAAEYNMALYDLIKERKKIKFDLTAEFNDLFIENVDHYTEFKQSLFLIDDPEVRERLVQIAISLGIESLR